MLLIAVCIPLLIGLKVEGRSSRGATDTWKDIREVLPEEYVKVAVDKGLHSSKSFHQNLIKLAYKKMILDTKAFAARHSVLLEYVECSCPRCPTLDIRIKRGVDLDLLKGISEVLALRQAEVVVDIFRLVSFTLEYVQKNNERMLKTVACNCPDASKCQGMLEPAVYSVISGQNDTELEKIFWEKSLEDFPPLVERGIMDTLSGAAASILSYAFQNFRPKPTDPPAVQLPGAMPAPPGPPSIFPPDQDPNYWLNPDFPVRKGCPDVHVNITNPRNTLEITGTDSITKN